MPDAVSPRLHPVVALRAIANLKRNRENTRQAVLLIDSLRGKTSLRQFARFRETETGRAVLAERRQLLDFLNDHGRLSGLPPGTLGRAYHDFMMAENLTAQGLAALAQIGEVLPAGDDFILFRERSRDMHDLLHVVTGYGREPLGEICLTAFSFAQTGLKGFAVIALVAGARIARRWRGEPVKRAVLEGYRIGRRAAWLYGADWESLLAEPVEAIRARYCLGAPVYYPQVLAAMRAPRRAAQAAGAVK